MPANPFADLARKAGQMTDDEFKNEFSNLTSLNNNEIAALINDTGISKENLAAVIKEVKKATDFNEQQANSIKNINKGVSVLMAVAKKFL